MTKFRAIASGLLLLTGVLHVYQFFLSPPSRVTTGVTVFGVLYLRLGAWIAAGHQRALREGRILPIIGAAAVSTTFRDGNSLLP